MNFRYILRIFTLLFLFHSVILVEAAHAQRWNVFGRIYEVESLWMEEALNKESNAQVHLVRSDLIKRHHGIRVKLISDSPRPPTIAGGVWKTEEPSSQPAPTVSLSIFDRNQKAFIDQPGTQSLPSVVGKSETIHMSEFWGAQNYGPLLFHFYDSDRGHCSKIVIVISGGKQRTREKMKERLHAGLQYIKETSESEYSSDLSPPSDGTHHDPDGAYSSSDSEVENQRHKRKLDELRRSQEKALEQLREQQKRELDELLRGQERQQLMQQQPSSQELNNYSEPPYELWQDSELYCPNAPIKFIDMLEQDWFTPLQLQDSPSSFDLLDSEREPPLKRPKLESGPEVQDSAGGQEEKKEIKEETVDALNLFQLDEDLLYELDDMEDIPSSQKPLTL